MVKRDFMNCEHEYVIQTKKGIPSLLPFVCIHCGMGSWFPTVEEEEKHHQEFMDKIKQSLREGKYDKSNPIFEEMKKDLGIE